MCIRDRHVGFRRIAISVGGLHARFGEGGDLLPAHQLHAVLRKLMIQLDVVEHRHAVGELLQRDLVDDRDLLALHAQHHRALQTYDAAAADHHVLTDRDPVVLHVGDRPDLFQVNAGDGRMNIRCV